MLLIRQHVVDGWLYFCSILQDVRVAAKGETWDVARGASSLLLFGIANFLKGLNDAIVTPVVNTLILLPLFGVHPVKLSLEAK